MTLTPFLIVYYAAAAWYLAYVLTQKSGPFAVLSKLRDFKGGRWHGRIYSPETTVTTYANTPYEALEKRGGELIQPGLLDCIICLSVWVALALQIVKPNILIDACAVAGVALWIHGLTTWRSNF